MNGSRRGRFRALGRNALLALLALHAVIADANAQAADTSASPLLALRPGLPIRLVSPGLGLAGDMSVLRTTRDTLVVVGRFGERAVPRTSIERLDVFNKHSTRGGVIRGAKVGAVFGVMNALLCAATCEPAERNKALVLSVPAFGLVGGAIGALFGGESYTRVIPARK